MIEITHTHADGTLVRGTSKGDGSAAVLSPRRFRWSRNLGAWYAPNSRDKAATRYHTEDTAQALRDAGHEVTVTVDETVTRSFAEAEAERYERAEARADRMAGHADSAARRSASLHAQAQQMADAIPFGQPVLVDHYSAGRDIRYRRRMVSTFERSFAEADKAEHYERRAADAASYRGHRENVPTTLRRIEKLEAELREIRRYYEGRLTQKRDPETGEWSAPALVKPSGEWLERLQRLEAEKSEQIAYWRGVIAQAEAAGVKVWSAADFTKGDFVLFIGTWYEVLRVNAKSLTIPGMIGAGRGPVCTRESSTVTWTDTIPYHKVKGRKSAQEIAAMAATPEAATA